MRRHREYSSNFAFEGAMFSTITASDKVYPFDMTDRFGCFATKMLPEASFQSMMTFEQLNIGEKEHQST